MRCGAGVFAATRLLWRLLMPSYSSLLKSPCAGVSGARFPLRIRARAPGGKQIKGQNCLLISATTAGWADA